MKRPSFQFYPGDWRSNANLRRCSHAERGIWLDVMCLMHDSEEYGVLRWPLSDISQAVSCKLQELKALAHKGVLKGTDSGLCEPFIYTPRHAGKDGEPVYLIPEQDGPVWYSSRMVKDEYLRHKRGEGTRFGDEPIPTPIPTPIPPIGVDLGGGIGYGASSSSSTSSSKKKKQRAVAPFVLPEWIPADAWAEWEKYRKEKRQALTDSTREKQIGALYLLYEKGQNPRAVIERSITQGWTGLFPLLKAGGGRDDDWGPPK